MMKHAGRFLCLRLSPSLSRILVILTLLALPVSTPGCSAADILPPTLTPTKTPRAPLLTPTAASTVSPTTSGTPSATGGVTGTAASGVTLSYTETITASPASDVVTRTGEIIMPDRAENVNPLTGLAVKDKSLLQRRPILVRIGNDPQIRPQSGLASADLVYEDIMDGWWITRLTAIFLSRDLEAVGPVRSARLVNLQIASQFDGGLVHSGASDPIRWQLAQSDIVDLDEFFHRTPYFYKEGADWRGRLFVNMVDLRAYMAKKGLEEAVPLRGFAFDKEPPAGTPATEVTIPYPKNSVVRYEYDPLSGHYLRFVQDAPHLDAVTGKQLSAANVVVQFVPHEETDIVEDSLGTKSIRITVIGEGKALVFRDGLLIEGRWKAEDPKEMPLFVDENGQVIRFKPGQTWIQLVPPDYELTILPAGAMGGSMSSGDAVTDTATFTGTVTLTSTATPTATASPAPTKAPTATVTARSRRP